MARDFKNSAKVWFVYIKDRAALDEYMGVWFCSEVIDAVESRLSAVIFRKASRRKGSKVELESLSEVTVMMKMAKFLNETMAKDDGRVLQLHNLERGAKERAVERECFAQKLLRGESV
nr:hypothetical protein [Tanacetum cinerariifolium]